RPGVRWSDGHPHTADDWVFWYEDVLQNKELTPTPSTQLTVGGSLMSLVKLDDYTIRFEFAVPHPSFALLGLAHSLVFGFDNALPGHYLKQFHLKYNPRAAEDAKAAGFESWAQLFAARRDPEQNKDVPNLGGFVVDKAEGGTVYYRRNPYFWMVDADGKQLPYLDQIKLDQLQSPDLIEARAMSGSYDFVWGGLQIKSFKSYKASEQAGGVPDVPIEGGLGAAYLYSWNLTYPDPVWRTVFQDVRFRRAMSVAINRAEINEVLYFGMATPAQMTAHPSSRAYKEQYARAWAQYDPGLANRLLD